MNKIIIPLLITFSLIFWLHYKVVDSKLGDYYFNIDEIAKKDSAFLRTYIKNMNLICKKEEYKFYAEYFDEIISEIKLNPHIAEYEKLNFSGRYLNNSQLPYLIKLLDSFSCLKEINFSLNQIDIKGVQTLCNFDFHYVNKIDVSNNVYGYNTDELISFLSPCKYKIIHKDKMLQLIK